MLTEAQVLDTLKAQMTNTLEDLDPNTITLSKTMRDLGANSIDEVEITSRVLRQLRIKIPLNELAKVDTIGEFVMLVVNRSQG